MDWAIPLLKYTIQEVRAAVAGQPNASRDALCYAVMRRMGLIGQSRATAEWEAIAVGYYHLALRSREGRCQEGGSVPFQVAQLNGDGGLDSRFRGNDGLSVVIPPKLERYLEEMFVDSLSASS